MTRFAIPFAALMLIALADPKSVSAQKIVSPDTRYELFVSGKKTIRLDRKLGAMSLCEQKSGGLVCRISADERQALQTENERLTKRIDELTRRIALLEPDNSAKGNGNSLLSKKNELEIDKALQTAERLLRGFMGVMKNLKDDFKTN